MDTHQIHEWSSQPKPEIEPCQSGSTMHPWDIRKKITEFGKNSGFVPHSGNK
jgi:hypothetical protein